MRRALVVEDEDEEEVDAVVYAAVDDEETVDMDAVDESVWEGALLRRLSPVAVACPALF